MDHMDHLLQQNDNEIISALKKEVFHKAQELGIMREKTHELSIAKVKLQGQLRELMEAKVALLKDDVGIGLNSL